MAAAIKGYPLKLIMWVPLLLITSLSCLHICVLQEYDLYALAVIGLQWHFVYSQCCQLEPVECLDWDRSDQHAIAA